MITFLEFNLDTEDDVQEALAQERKLVNIHQPSKLTYSAGTATIWST